MIKVRKKLPMSSHKLNKSSKCMHNYDNKSKRLWMGITTQWVTIWVMCSIYVNTYTCVLTSVSVTLYCTIHLIYFL